MRFNCLHKTKQNIFVVTYNRLLSPSVFWKGEGHMRMITHNPADTVTLLQKYLCYSIEIDDVSVHKQGGNCQAENTTYIYY